MPRDLPQWTLDRRRELGHRIADLRGRARLSQEAFAEKSGLDRRTLQRIEAGESDPPYSSLLLIAYALEMTVPELTDIGAAWNPHPDVT